MLTKEQAVAEILQKILQLRPSAETKSNEIQFWTEKLVFDVLDYCHRKDFPEALIYTCADLILKRLADCEMVSGDSDTAVAALPLSEIKQDDTSYKFDTSLAIKTTAADNVGLLADLDFDSIKPRLNLYRKLVSF